MNWFHEHTDVVEQYCTYLAKVKHDDNILYINSYQFDPIIILILIVLSFSLQFSC